MHFSKNRFDALILLSSTDKACNSVFNSLKFFQFLFWETIEDTLTATVVLT